MGTILAWMAAKKDKRLASGTFFTTMLDFSSPGELGVFVDERTVASLEKKMEQRGLVTLNRNFIELHANAAL